MKKHFAILMCSLLILALASCSSEKAAIQDTVPTTLPEVPTEAKTEAETDPKYMQWQKLDTLEDGIAATGIDLTIPELLDEFDVLCIANKGKHGIQAWGTRLVSSNVEEILIVKTVGSGNNNVNECAYNEEMVMDIGGIDITFRLQDGNVSLAYWNVGEYAYSLMYRGFAADLDTAIEMINQIT